MFVHYIRPADFNKMLQFQSNRIHFITICGSYIAGGWTHFIEVLSKRTGKSLVKQLPTWNYVPYPWLKKWVKDQIVVVDESVFQS